MKEHSPQLQSFYCVWDALEDTPQDAANMRLLTKLRCTLSRENSPVRPATPMDEADRKLQMLLWISGFLKGDDEDDTLKYELTVGPKFEPAVLAAMGWKSLDESPDGEWLLTLAQAQKIGMAINEKLPSELDLFIGIRG
ncbi:DUF2513 domain-containing protein [Pseudomonas sp. IT-347P]|uniref:pyocin S6 family toxin immunity protein n=1 Tax=Pseudomonas sp. IT-347P TaxID=3026458 RepID=UPI0039E0DD21